MESKSQSDYYDIYKLIILDGFHRWRKGIENSYEKDLGD